MKLLTFQAERFAWQPFQKTLPTAPDVSGETVVSEAVVVFMHVEAADVTEERRSSSFKKTLKHVKWLANKRELRSVVLHSFTHLGGDAAEPDLAESFMNDLGERLATTGYSVARTPFGWFCSWDLAVYGESLAKVWKEF